MVNWTAPNECTMHGESTCNCSVAEIPPAERERERQQLLSVVRSSTIWSFTGDTVACLATRLREETRKKPFFVECMCPWNFYWQRKCVPVQPYACTSTLVFYIYIQYRAIQFTKAEKAFGLFASTTKKKSANNNRIFDSGRFDFW